MTPTHQEAEALAYYFDHHVNQAIADGLQRCGVDIMIAFDDGAAELDDDQVLQRATDLGRILFTQDVDFLGLAKTWQQIGRDFAGIVYGHQLHLAVGVAVVDLEIIAKAATAEEMRNRVEFIPL